MDPTEQSQASKYYQHFRFKNTSKMTVKYFERNMEKNSCKTIIFYLIHLIHLQRLSKQLKLKIMSNFRVTLLL